MDDGSLMCCLYQWGIYLAQEIGDPVCFDLFPPDLDWMYFVKNINRNGDGCKGKGEGKRGRIDIENIDKTKWRVIIEHMDTDDGNLLTDYGLPSYDSYHESLFTALGYKRDSRDGGVCDDKQCILVPLTKEDCDESDLEEENKNGNEKIELDKEDIGDNNGELVVDEERLLDLGESPLTRDGNVLLVFIWGEDITIEAVSEKSDDILDAIMAENRSIATELRLEAVEYLPQMPASLLFARRNQQESKPNVSKSTSNNNNDNNNNTNRNKFILFKVTVPLKEENDELLGMFPSSNEEHTVYLQGIGSTRLWGAPKQETAENQSKQEKEKLEQSKRESTLAQEAVQAIAKLTWGTRRERDKTKFSIVSAPFCTRGLRRKIVRIIDPERRMELHCDFETRYES